MNNREREQLWQLYRVNIAEGRQYSLRDWGLLLGKANKLGFVNLVEGELEAQAVVAKLINTWVSSTGALIAPEKAKGMSDEQKIVELGIDFLSAAEWVETTRFNQLLEAGVPVNFQHPRDLETAIHITSSRNSANTLTEQLLLHSEIDLLLRDKFGRQAWNNAEFFGIERGLAGRVLDATEQQAEDQTGLDVFYQEYQDYLRQWINQLWFCHLTHRHFDEASPTIE